VNGTGLGRAIAKWVADEHDATLTDLLQLATRGRRNLLIPHKEMLFDGKS
jgi:hypothetical protein